MNIRTFSIVLALAATAFSATTANAQSAFVMTIGEAATAEKEREPYTATVEERVERAIQTACAKPASRDLKANRLYRECVTELRSEFAEIERAPVVIAAR